MSRTLKEVERDIERKRGILNKAGKRLGVHSPYVLRKSQELDCLINEYTAMTMDRRNRKI